MKCSNAALLLSQASAALKNVEKHFHNVQVMPTTEGDSNIDDSSIAPEDPEISTIK